MPLKLHTIITSTRPGRIGPSLATWFHQAAVEHGMFDAELVDLATFGLPVFDEPKHPMMRAYEHEHTKRWSASVKRADAFVFVTPEYNFGPPPSLLNALDYLFHEWHYTPAGFVSYGGAAGAVRAVQVEKLMMTTLRIIPITEAVTVPVAWNQIDAAKVFTPNDVQKAAVAPLLNELYRLAQALAPLRAEKRAG